ncbi:hypothetical protein BDR03DRAFT_939173 [Suillus americanus]|nr:hypothetical protein BDR03DRAFT_939173 [Suillus americanus]
MYPPLVNNAAVACGIPSFSLAGLLVHITLELVFTSRDKRGTPRFNSLVLNCVHLPELSTSIQFNSLLRQHYQCPTKPEVYDTRKWDIY